LALQQRALSGRGQRVETSLLDAAFHLQVDFLTYALNGWRYAEGPTEDQPYGIFPTKDGNLALAHAELEALARLLEEPALATIPAKERLTRGAEIRALVERGLRRRPAREWLEILERAGIWCAPVSTYDEVLDLRQVLTDDRRWELDHRTAGRVATLGVPVTLSASPAELRRSPPLLGEHTGEILLELGFAEAEIEAMRADGAI
jgi:crotonobetainyl-CoA:carnitine CoA-transferase CaiB-like acyl-CoA transferase